MTAAAPFLLVAALAFGPLAAWLASRRLRNPAVWLVLGALTGPVGLLLLAIAPPGRCPVCGESAAGFGGTCWMCGSSLRTGDARRRAAVPVVVPAARPMAAPAPPPSGRAPSAQRAAAAPAPAAARGPAPATAVRGSRRSTATARRTTSPAIADAPSLAASTGRRSRGSASRRVVDVDEARSRPDLTILAIAVFVQGTEGLQPGSRYLIARTVDRLVVIGPLEPAPEHIAVELPLDEVEATYVPDRLVVSGWNDRRRGRWALAFQGLAGLTASAIDEALTAPAPTPQAVARP